MRISDWSSDVCSSDLAANRPTIEHVPGVGPWEPRGRPLALSRCLRHAGVRENRGNGAMDGMLTDLSEETVAAAWLGDLKAALESGDAARIGMRRSEEHTSELQSLMRNSYAVFCLKK